MLNYIWVIPKPTFNVKNEKLFKFTHKINAKYFYFYFKRFGDDIISKTSIILCVLKYNFIYNEYLPKKALSIKYLNDSNLLAHIFLAENMKKSESIKITPVTKKEMKKVKKAPPNPSNFKSAEGNGKSSKTNSEIKETAIGKTYQIKCDKSLNVHDNYRSPISHKNQAKNSKPSKSDLGRFWIRYPSYEPDILEEESELCENSNLGISKEFNCENSSLKQNNLLSFGSFNVQSTPVSCISNITELNEKFIPKLEHNKIKNIFDICYSETSNSYEEEINEKSSISKNFNIKPNLEYTTFETIIPQQFKHSVYIKNSKSFIVEDSPCEMGELKSLRRTNAKVFKRHRGEHNKKHRDKTQSCINYESYTKDDRLNIHYLQSIIPQKNENENISVSNNSKLLTQEIPYIHKSAENIQKCSYSTFKDLGTQKNQNKFIKYHSDSDFFSNKKCECDKDDTNRSIIKKCQSHKSLKHSVALEDEKYKNSYWPHIRGSLHRNLSCNPFNSNIKNLSLPNLSKSCPMIRNQSKSMINLRGSFPNLSIKIPEISNSPKIHTIKPTEQPQIFSGGI